MNRKGVSVLVAAVLLIGITLSVSVLFSDFLPNLVEDLTSETSENINKTSAASNYRIEIHNAKRNTVQDHVNVTLRNRGESFQDNVTVILHCSSDEILQKTVEGFKSAEVRTTGFKTSCKPEKVESMLNNHPVSTEKDDFERQTYGSWTQSAASSFESIALETQNIIFSSVQLDQQQTSQTEETSFSGVKTNLTEQNGALKLASD